MPKPCCDKQCLHFTGTGSHYYTGGEDVFTCCNCGEEQDRRWTLVHMQLEGHGPCFKQGCKVYLDEKVAIEEEEWTGVTSEPHPGAKHA